MTGSGGREARPGLVLALCSGASFMAFLDLSVVNIAFPEIMEDFPGTSVSVLTWVASAYAVTFAAFLAPAGRLADTAGRDRVFTWSVIGFTLASLLCGLAPAVELLIAGRLLQGAAAAGMIPAALALIIADAPGGKLLKAIGTWSAVTSVSAVVGPIVGGVLVERFGWPSVFLINVPVGAVLAVWARRTLPRHAPPAGSKRPDALGTLALLLGVGGIVAGFTEGDGWGWGSPATIGVLGGGAALGVLSLLRSRRHPAPAVEIGLWRSGRYAVCNVTAFLFGTAMFPWLLANPLFATQIWHWSILESAAALTIGGVAAGVTAKLAGRIVDPAGHRWLIAAGTVLFAAGTGLNGSDLFLYEVRFWDAWVPVGVLCGAGVGLVMTAVSAAAATALPPPRFAAGLGLSLTVRQLGGALGIAGLAALLASRSVTDVETFHTIYLLCGGIGLAAGVAALFMPAPGTPHPDPHEEEASKIP
ncbi:DHA2 family efflux MFS transporter permease subunit [Actinomadura chokoriensis]|uniref:DHA2 family efflux MFS transporter permease subunit n=1 Tax=Actinomadura chokoriensis TaxID=454156 RepID=A0ABV4R3I3_9ACTN